MSVSAETLLHLGDTEQLREEGQTVVMDPMIFIYIPKGGIMLAP